MGMKKQNMICQIILNALFIVMAVAVIIPFIILVSVSLSNETDISYFGYRLIPKQIDLTAYRYVFKHPKTILDAYKVTAIFSFVSMILNTVCAIQTRVSS